MSTNDLDLPVQPSAEQIRRREFASVRRGYDPDQVRDYLTSVAGQLEKLEKDLRDAKLAAETATERAAAAASVEPAGDPYEVLGKRIAGLIGTADKEATRLLDEARGEAARIVEEARADADRIRVDAQSRAEEARAEGNQILQQARAEADRALSSLASRRQQLVDQLQTMQSRLISAANDLEVSIDEPSTEDLPETIAAAEAAASASAPGTTAVKEEPGEASSGAPADDSLPMEELWVSSDESVDLPDLASIEFDFDDDKPAGDA